MNNRSLDNMLWVFLPYVVALVSERLGLSMKETNKLIYKSELYKKLEDSKTKMWYFSDVYLAEFFLEEYENEGKKVGK